MWNEKFCRKFIAFYFKQSFVGVHELKISFINICDSINSK